MGGSELSAGSTVGRGAQPSDAADAIRPRVDDVRIQLAAEHQRLQRTARATHDFGFLARGIRQQCRLASVLRRGGAGIGRRPMRPWHAL